MILAPVEEWCQDGLVSDPDEIAGARDAASLVFQRSAAIVSRFWHAKMGMVYLGMAIVAPLIPVH